jgi:anti-sigma factor RsiW
VANMDQFREFQGFDERPAACAVCETMLPEAVDGMLSESEQRAFDKHLASCVECSRELAEAQRGAAWLSMLKSQAPEPPAGLLAKILAETTGAVQYASSPVAAPVASVPVWESAPRLAPTKPTAGWSTRWVAFRRQLSDVFSIESARATFQPRMAMTAAMAFFSIALTLNLTGVRLRDLRASNFTPSAIKRTVADVDASATRMFQNNRAVYKVESRLNELRNDDSTNDSSPSGRR